MRRKGKLRKLLELIFIKKPSNLAELTLLAPSLPGCFLENCFYTKMRYVLLMRQVIISWRWDNIILEATSKVLSSHAKYVSYLIQACMTENTFNLNAFDCFISICCLVEYFNKKIYGNSGVDFSDINSDIVIVFYDNVLKENFLKLGGFERFSEYICQHEYLEWRWDKEDLLSSGSPSSPVNIATQKMVEDEVVREIHFQRRLKPDMGLNKEKCRESIKLTNIFLGSTKVNLPTLPKEEVLIRRILAKKQDRDKEKISPERRRMLKVAAILNIFDQLCSDFSNSNLDSVPNKELKDSEQVEKVVEAVTRINRSRNSVLVNSDSNNLKKPREILEHMKTKVESLIQLLD